MVIENVQIQLQFARKTGDYMISEDDLGKLEAVLGFQILEAGVVDGSTLVVYRLVPPELEGLIEDTYCYNCIP